MQQFISHTKVTLKDLYSESEIQQMINLLIEKITGWSRNEILLNKNTIFSFEQREILNSFIEKLKKSEPIQYITGETSFYGLTFLVNQHVLIPRPETEELVEWIIGDNSQQNHLKILDIGTGSGCIAVSLKSRFKNSDVDAWDISEDALQIAEQNASSNQCQVNFNVQDILKITRTNKKWDIIVSNPPYIPLNEISEINSNVIDFEPHIALFVYDNNPLLFYEKIADFSLKHLNDNGNLYFEVHEKMGEDCVEMLNNKGFKEVTLKRDISGNNRMINAKFS